MCLEIASLQGTLQIPIRCTCWEQKAWEDTFVEQSKHCWKEQALIWMLVKRTCLTAKRFPDEELITFSNRKRTESNPSFICPVFLSCLVDKNAELRWKLSYRSSIPKSGKRPFQRSSVKCHLAFFMQQLCQPCIMSLVGKCETYFEGVLSQTTSQRAFLSLRW